MEASRIVELDLLDIIFEGRNKEYGAYDLRKTYNMRLLRSLGAMGALIFLLLIGWELSKRETAGKKNKIEFGPEVTIDPLTLVQKTDPPLRLPRPRILLPKLATISFVRPRIVKDELVKENEKPPEQTELEGEKIGILNKPGVAGTDVTDPPVSGAGNGVAGPAKQDDGKSDNFIPIEIESEYPGGAPAWQRYLNKEFRYPDEAVSVDIQGVVEVQFVVDKDGNVSDVQAISGPDKGGLREEAVRVIKKSGKWTPAVQNGRQVRSYKRQSIVFRLSNE